MGVFTELLPATVSEKHGCLTWEPISTEDTPLAGILTISGKRSHTRYMVSESPATDPGRAFTLRKSVEDGGGFYSCFISSEAPHLDQCDCRGFQSTGGRCKHTAALLILLKENQL